MLGYHKELKSVLKRGGIFLLIGTVYLLWCCFSPIRIPCVFNLITGWDCPGCGMTRAMVEIAHLNFGRAMEYNLLSLTVLPVTVLLLVYMEIRYLRTGERKMELPETILVTFMLVVAIGYAILRNVFHFSDLWA